MLHHIAYRYLFEGTVRQGGNWGGAECSSSIPFNTHILETVFWLFVGFVIWKELALHSEYIRLTSHAEQYYAKIGREKGLHRVVELCIGSIEGVILLVTIYYKINKGSLCYLLQPCHLVLCIQSYSLLFDNAFGSVLSTISLSMVTGTIAAILFPDTSGLEQPYETELYWIQHYIIQLVPILLLLRNNGLMLKMTTLKSILFANWCVLLLHWLLYEVFLK